MSALAISIAAALILLPGLGATVLVFGPGEVSVPSRAALSFAFGCGIAGGLAFLLALAGVLSPAPYFIGLAMATGLCWFLGLRRASPRAHVQGLREAIRRDPWVLLAGAVVLLAIAVIRLAYSPSLHFGNTTAWRYWADAVEIADAGRIPSRVLQYGGVYLSTVNKVLLNTLNGGLSFAIGNDPLRGMSAMLWLGSVGLAVSLWALGWELGLRWTAPLVPVVLIANRLILNRELTADLVTYKAELFGRLVAFTAAALAIRGLRDRKTWRDPIVAGVLVGMAAAIHIVPVIIVALLVGAYALCRLVIDGDRLRVLRFAAVTPLIALAVGAFLLFLPHGDLGFQGQRGGVAVTDEGEGFDPTFYINTGRVSQSDRGTRSYALSPLEVLRSYTRSATGSRVGTQGSWLVIAGLVLAAAVAVLAAIFLPSSLRAIPATMFLLGLGIVVLTWLFSLRYQLYIPARFGVRRLYDYSSIPLVLTGLALAEAGLVFVGRSAPRAARVVGVTLVVVIAAAVLLSSRPPSVSSGMVGLEEGFAWLRAETSCDARFLPNEHTEGVFEALPRRVAVLEGATPYLRPSIIRPIVQLFLQARAFFQDPASNVDLLRSRQIDYVVLLRAGGVGYRSVIGRTEDQAIDELPVLERLFRNQSMTVYRVAGSGRHTGVPDPARYPGYDCAAAART